MGRIVIPKAQKEKIFDIQMKWFEADNLLVIAGLEPGAKGIGVIVNDVEYEVDVDLEGKAELEFEKSEEPILYKVRLKEPDKKDQRMGFLF